MEKYTLDFLKEKEAIFCGKLEEFYKNKKNY